MVVTNPFSHSVTSLRVSPDFANEKKKRITTNRPYDDGQQTNFVVLRLLSLCSPNEVIHANHRWFAWLTFHKSQP
ncbi:hypothetical protein Y032_0001g290 [Ancylostoma ceylanicum]|nr:hypothetical protein Y032_0001g290 [Ancylostoma ceylanicum]